jgi:hypothetical protein
MFSSPEEYLTCKLEIKETGNISPGEQWYKNVTLDPKNIPRCKRCIEDTIKFEQLATDDKFKLKNMSETEKYMARRNKKLRWEPNCSKHCLWFDWYDYKRMNSKK